MNIGVYSDNISDSSILSYAYKMSNISINDLSELEISYIKSNINLDNCIITNISQLKCGKSITLVMSDIPDHYSVINKYKRYYLLKWKKTNGDIYLSFNERYPDFRSDLFKSSKGYELSSYYHINKVDIIGYKNGMGCELIDMYELLIPCGTEKVIDNSDYFSQLDNNYVITDENIIDTSIFLKKENV